MTEKGQLPDFALEYGFNFDVSGWNKTSEKGRDYVSYSIYASSYDKETQQTKKTQIGMNTLSDISIIKYLLQAMFNNVMKGNKDFKCELDAYSIEVNKDTNKILLKKHYEKNGQAGFQALVLENSYDALRIIDLLNRMLAVSLKPKNPKKIAEEEAKKNGTQNQPTKESNDEFVDDEIDF